MEIPFFRSPFNYDRDAASDESGLACGDRSLAIQSAKEECDINTIVERFGLTGQLPDDVRAPQYADFTEVVDYHSAMNAVALAREAFDAMPAGVRARFHHDPQELLDFCANSDNAAEAAKLGLTIPKVASSLVDGNVAVAEVKDGGSESGSGVVA